MNYRQWRTREDLYDESTGFLIDYIENLQKTVDTLDKQIIELSFRNAYLEDQFVEILKNRLEKLSG